MGRTPRVASGAELGRSPPQGVSARPLAFPLRHRATARNSFRQRSATAGPAAMPGGRAPTGSSSGGGWRRPTAASCLRARSGAVARDQSSAPRGAIGQSSMPAGYRQIYRAARCWNRKRTNALWLQSMMWHTHDAVGLAGPMLLLNVPLIRPNVARCSVLLRGDQTHARKGSPDATRRSRPRDFAPPLPYIPPTDNEPAPSPRF